MLQSDRVDRAELTGPFHRASGPKAPAVDFRELQVFVHD